jgi:hypothetical protein
MPSPERPPAAAPSKMVRLGTTVVALASVVAGKALIACQLRRAPEGWRRTLGILLRSEPTRFALSAFGVRVPARALDAAHAADLERGIAGELRAYLAGQPDAHFALEWQPSITLRRRLRSIDVALLGFSVNGDLDRVTPLLADAAADDDASPRQARVRQVLIAAYNQTRHLPEIERPTALSIAFDAARASDPDLGDRQDVTTYAQRLLTACCVSFESVDVSNPIERFRPPDFSARRGFGFGFLTVVMRLAADRRHIDVWMSAHHVGLDGVPLQELVSGLEHAWGTSDGVLFPPADLEQPFMRPRECSVPGERDVDEILTFVDFSPVLALRQALNERYAGELRGPVTFGSVFAWLLHLEPELAGVRIASTVDVAASGGYERDVDVVSLRPADFAAGAEPLGSTANEWDGFAAFATEFNRLVLLSRARSSPTRKAMQTAGLLPAWAHAESARANPAALDETFGTLCVTIVRDAKVFVAPMTDLGLGDGFFAIGNIRLPATDGGRVASVSIKGDPKTVARNHVILQRVIKRCAALQPAMASGVSA